ncbi:MAG: methyl-accepting chemotaxis protein [Treponema sp.]|jgi:methyl-accepting chemotaxis protein|nr:methyl-accepting chemotaxis protein [Treponema sp.]
MKQLLKKAGLQLKIVGLSSVVLILAIVVTEVTSTMGMRQLGIQTALTMGDRALNGYMHYLVARMNEEHGQLRLSGNQLIDRNGNSITNDFRVADEISRAVNTQVSISVRDGNDFRRVSTTLLNQAGGRDIGTLLTADSEALQPLLRGEFFRERTHIHGIEHFAYYRPIFAENTRDVIGYIAVLTEMHTIYELISDSISSQIVQAGIMTTFILVLAILVLFFSCKIMLIKPIEVAVVMLKEISEGEGDLTRKLEISSEDEVGRMAYYFNSTLQRIRNLVISIRTQATSLSGIGSELASSMEETAAAVNEISVNTQNISSRIMSQSAGVTQTYSTMEQVTQNIGKLNGHVETQTSAVSQSSAAIEEMIANIHSVTSTLSKNTENVRELDSASEVGRSSLAEVITDIQGIARESESLMEINSVMQNIASQTNLLSMNAAIEAAHAGEAGRGFAVVADEIRKLAESSSAQSKTIGGVLKKIKTSIDKITQSTDNVLRKFEAIENGVKVVAQQEESILRAMEEQGQGSRQVLQGIGQLSEISDQVKGGSLQMMEGSREVMLECKNLQNVTQEISGGMIEMATGTDEINIAVNRIKELSGSNRESIQILMSEVSKFKV